MKYGRRRRRRRRRRERELIRKNEQVCKQGVWSTSSTCYSAAEFREEVTLFLFTIIYFPFPDFFTDPICSLTFSFSILNSFPFPNSLLTFSVTHLNK